MALTTGGFATYAAIGNREDLADTIYDISPTRTPFVSAVGRSKAKATFHEWQTDSLAALDTGNAHLEGDDVVPATSSPTTRVGNYAQISRKTLAVTGTQEVVDKAGRKSEWAYQIAKRGKEIKRDIEAMCLGNTGQNAGDSTTARVARSLNSWLTTNTNRGSSGADATAATAAATDATAGDMRTFTETILKDVIRSVWTAGGEADMLLVGPVNKQRVSDFTGRASARQNIAADKIQAAASLYASDFGDIKVIPNDAQRERDAWLVDPSMASVAYLRPFMTEDLAKIGDSRRGFLLAEWTLRVNNEAAHGLAADLLTT